MGGLRGAGGLIATDPWGLCAWAGDQREVARNDNGCDGPDDPWWGASRRRELIRAVAADGSVVPVAPDPDRCGLRAAQAEDPGGLPGFALV
eukprot:15327903-Heterocapsa_arctica.AAC.1